MPDADPEAPEPGGSRPAPRAGHTPPAQNKWWTLTAVCLGTFMLLLDITIVNVALPDIQRSLHASFSDLQWVVDAYSSRWPPCCSRRAVSPTCTAARSST